MGVRGIHQGRKTGNPVPEVEGERQEVNERSVKMKIPAYGLLL